MDNNGACSNILIQLQNRVNGISDNIVKIEQELVQLDINATENIELINQRCDGVLQIIENYRQSLLKSVEKLKNVKKQQLNAKLKALKSIHNIASQTSNKCETHVSNISTDNNMKSYKLIFLNKIINEGNKKEDQLCIDDKITKDNKKKTIHINFKKIMETQLNIKIHLDGNHSNNIPFDNNKITITIPTQIKHRILIENWFRILYVNSNKMKQKISAFRIPNEIINLINAFSSLSLNDTFDSSINYKTISINNNGCVAQKMDLILKEQKYETIFGSVIASPGCVYKWKIKIMDRINEIKFMNIGIIEAEKCDVYVNKCWWLTSIGYAYFSADGNFYHKDNATFGGVKVYGQRYHKNDIIHIHLDLKRNTIAFGKNTRVYSHQNVKENTNYKLAVAISNSRDCIQLLSSTVEN